MERVRDRVDLFSLLSSYTAFSDEIGEEEDRKRRKGKGKGIEWKKYSGAVSFLFFSLGGEGVL